MKVGNVFDPVDILEVLQEVETEIRNDGICPQQKALLYHELGSIHGLMGDKNQQKGAWQKALELDPRSEMIMASLKSLK